MRITHVTHQFPPETHGGVEMYVRDLAKAQQASGDEVDVITGSLVPWDPVGGEEVDIDGLNVYRVHRDDLFFDAWDNMSAPRMGRVIHDRLEERRPHVVHVHHWIRLTHDLSRHFGALDVPFVATLHDLATSCPRAFRMRPPDDAPCFRRLGVDSCGDCVPRRPWQTAVDVAREIEFFVRNGRAELSRAAALICASAAVRDIIADSLRIDAERFRVVPLAYEPRFQGMTTPPAESGPLRIGFWGSLTYRKGVRLLVDAFRSIHASRPSGLRPVELDIFGQCESPELEADLRTAADGLPVRFHGRYEYRDLAEAGLHIAVFPSLCIETYGLVLDEAFELGLPVVVPDIGSLAERAGGGGRQFTAGDAGSLARELGAVLDDESVRAALRSGRPAEPMTPDAHRAALHEIYESAARGEHDEILETVTDQERAEHAAARLQSQFRRLVELDGPGTS